MLEVTFAKGKVSAESLSFGIAYASLVTSGSLQVAGTN